ncbi:MAG: hypothetical protein GPOALKHO_001546 [Sodalis sp.]|nr:MAG: hypothetical protein GPOALKHO_001546 [Sodalis sp.]
MADLYLTHRPVPSKDNHVQAWRNMVKLKEEGLAKASECVIASRTVSTPTGRNRRDASDKPN